MPGEDWDAHYQSGAPPWETGSPSSELARVIEAEKITPCRVLELGCGSGINAVWLARRGFEVTAVDFNRLAIEKATRRAADAGVAVNFLQADVLRLPDLGEPFPFFFDRGCYHAVRLENAEGYVRSLQRVTSACSRGLLLTGNAKERHTPGPPVVSDGELHAELEPAFEIVRLREFRFDGGERGEGPLAWSCFVRRS